MLQRLRELSVQSANDTNTNTDRAFLQSEVNLLIAEITRISANTRFNQTTVLDGTFTNKVMQVGTEGGETIQFSVDSVAGDKLGAYQVTGDRIEAIKSAAVITYDSSTHVASNNVTDTADDIIINGNTVSKTINVADQDNAAMVAAKINEVAGETGVSAQAKNYAHYYSTWKADQTANLTINKKTTGQFTVSSTNVADAIDKINGISGSTGVTATATSDNKVLLYASDGRDIQIENQTAILGQRVASVSHDGTSIAAVAGGVAGVKESAATIGTTDGTATTWYVRNQHTGESATLAFDQGADVALSLAAVNTALGNLSGDWAAAGAHHITATTTNTNKQTFTGTAALGDFQIYTDVAMTTSLLETTSDTLGLLKTNDVRLVGTGVTSYEGNTTTGDSATVQGTLSLSASKLFSVTQSGTELAVNDNYFSTSTGVQQKVSNIDLRSQVGASNAIAVLDGAIEKISSMRADLGAIENRLSHTVSNLMNIAENTAEARSRIDDADYSVESANLAKAQVLQQAGTAMLSQANARAQLVLQLLQ
jgi:flagellin